MESCLIFAFALAIIAVVFGIAVFALTWAWSLFMVPILGLPALEWYQALGLLVFVAVIGGMFNWHTASSSK